MINGCGREACQTVNKEKAHISLKWSEDQLIYTKSIDVRIKLPTDNHEELSMDDEGLLIRLTRIIIWR